MLLDHFLVITGAMPSKGHGNRGVILTNSLDSFLDSFLYHTIVHDSDGALKGYKIRVIAMVRYGVIVSLRVRVPSGPPFSTVKTLYINGLEFY